jgi:pimeloyl-ACP methyl ester carboxylesterase
LNKSKSDKPVLFYEKKGSGKNTIILIHGFGLNRKSWYDIAPVLAEKSMIYMVDLIGSGDSPAPEFWPYTIDAQVETIFDFIRDKNLSDIVLVGHSYGGGVALRLLHKMIEN